MPSLTTQSQLTAVQKLEFCYLCGNPIEGPESVTRDHVPPKSIFSIADRTPPLILPTHRRCNQGESILDERIGQLLASIHGRIPSPGRLRLHLSGHEDPDTGERVALLTNVNLMAVINRWLRGFHAALYNQYLPDTPEVAILPPFPRARMENETLTWDELLPQYPRFVEHLKKNRETASVDQIIAFNGKCRYECTWDKTDDGKHWLCVFGLQIYDWIKMADDTPAPPRGCVGAYMPAAGRPNNATVSTCLEFPVRNADPLNPFGA